MEIKVVINKVAIGEVIAITVATLEAALKIWSDANKDGRATIYISPSP